jgi:hypothetical protein
MRYLATFSLPRNNREAVVVEADDIYLALTAARKVEEDPSELFPSADSVRLVKVEEYFRM